MLLNRILRKEPIAAKGLRANTIVERLHEMFGDILRAQSMMADGNETTGFTHSKRSSFAARATVDEIAKLFHPSRVNAKKVVVCTEHQSIT